MPHTQLKKIRSELHISQARTAALLGIRYQYYVSVETGQRELSKTLAARIGDTFGVARINQKHERPFMRGPRGTQRPFSKRAYEEYASKPPAFRDHDAGIVMTPTVEDYARSAHALLEAARRQLLLRPVLVGFFDWFARSIGGDRMFERLKQCFDELYPGQRKKSAAYYALTLNWGARDEEDIHRLLERRAAAAERAAAKRKRQRSQK